MMDTLTLLDPDAMARASDAGRRASPSVRPGPDSVPPRSVRGDGPDSVRRRPSVPPVAELSTSFGRLQASSICMREVFTLLNRLAPTEITITLIGETGTGKDVLARAIHTA